MTDIDPNVGQELMLWLQRGKSVAPAMQVSQRRYSESAALSLGLFSLRLGNKLAQQAVRNRGYTLHPLIARKMAGCRPVNPTEPYDEADFFAFMAELIHCMYASDSSC